jgi:ribose 5-phosphate isomerase RpiB
MQYCDYIAADNARREREQQLLNKYNQEAKGHKVQNLWLHQVERSVHYKISFWEVLSIIGAVLMVGVVILLSIWL